VAVASHEPGDAEATAVAVDPGIVAVKTDPPGQQDSRPSAKSDQPMVVYYWASD
jgi:hypothetical protein